MFVHDTPVQAQLADALVLVRKTRSFAKPEEFERRMAATL